MDSPTETNFNCLRGLQLGEAGEVEAIGIKSYLSRVPKNVGEKMVQSALAALKEDLYTLPNRLDVEVYDVTSRAAGSGAWVDVTARLAPSGGVIAAAAHTQADYTRAPPAAVGRAAGAEFLGALGCGAAVDAATLALLVPCMALACGVSEVALGSEAAVAVGEGCEKGRFDGVVWHMVEVVRRLTGARFEVVMGGGGERKVLRCVGVGYVPRLAYSVQDALGPSSSSSSSSSSPSLSSSGSLSSSPKKSHMHRSYSHSRIVK